MSDQRRERHDDREKNQHVDDREKRRRGHQMKLAHRSEYSYRWGR
jgi:hypothetical protein